MEGPVGVGGPSTVCIGIQWARRTIYRAMRLAYKKKSLALLFGNIGKNSQHASRV